MESYQTILVVNSVLQDGSTPFHSPSDAVRRSNTREWCIYPQMTITMADDTVLGHVEQEYVMYTPTLTVKNAQDESVLKIVGPGQQVGDWRNNSVKDFMV